MRCPACGATNPDGAAWCGQCYASLPPPAATAAADLGRPADKPSGAVEGFRRRGEQVEWACSTCGAFTSLEQSHCGVCGSAFAQRFAADEPAEPPNWPAAVALSAVAPGAGHLALRRYATGLGRLLLFAVWLLGGLALLGAGGPVPLVAGPLFVGAAVLWAGSLVDVLRLRRGEPELLAGRPLLWLVVGVIVGSLLGALVAVASVPRPAAGPVALP